MRCRMRSSLPLDGLGVGSYVGWFIGVAMAGLGIGGQALIARAMEEEMSNWAGVRSVRHWASR